MALSLLILTAGPPTVRAQEKAGFTDSRTVTLGSGQSAYPLGSHIYITRDPGWALNSGNYRKFVDRHLAGERGDTIKGNILNMKKLPGVR